jgi:hypothetical protein
MGASRVSIVVITGLAAVEVPYRNKNDDAKAAV